MAATRFSADAHAMVNEIWQELGEAGESRMRWKMVALVLAEALIKTDEDCQSLLTSEFAMGWYSRPTTKTEQYLKEAMHGQA